MSVALRVQDVDVLFGNDDRHPTTERRALVLPRPVDEPPGYRVGLADVNFSVNGGDCLAVLGASGDGKSSLLKSLAGLQLMRRGTVLVNGRDVSALPPEQRGIVYLHQEPVLFPHLDVLENVAFPLILRGMPKREAMFAAFRQLEVLKSADVAGNASDALSGGQRHRVALARALCAEPAVLLLDEPLASLDPAVRRDVRTALLEARAASGAAMVLVTHDLDDALAVATHMSLIDWGTLTPPALPGDLLQSPPSLAAARLLGVFSEVSGEVIASDMGPQFRWAGGLMPAPNVEVGPAAAFIRSHDVLVKRAAEQDADALTVIERRNAVFDVAVTMQNGSGESVVLRTAFGTICNVGDIVHVTLNSARVFTDHWRRHV